MTSTISGGPTQTVGNLLARRAQLSADAPAVIAGTTRMSFVELDRAANRHAHALMALGVKKGDRIGVLAPNGAEFCILFYAAARIGAVCCGLNYRLAPAELAVIVNDSQFELMFVDPGFAALADDATAGIAGVRMIAMGGAHLQDIMAGLPDSLPSVQPVAPDDPLLLVYTSGTTGRPKGAVITHDQIFWASLTIGQTVDYRQGDAHLLPVPMFHVGGLSFTVHFVHAGATLVIPERWDAHHVLDLIEAEKVRHFFSVPTMLTDLLKAARAAPERLRSVRWILSGGAPVPPSLVREYGALGIPVMQSYGATETCGPGICVDAAHATAKAGAIGLPFFHTECQLIDDDGNEPAQGSFGEILLRGRHVFAGYWKNPEATAEALTADGWFRTGDIGYADEDGYIFLVDRRKNMIITGGENVYPREVEQVLEQHPAVSEIAVVGIPDPRWGEAICAVVVARADAFVTLEELNLFAADRVARYKLPKQLRLCSELPKNVTGKLLRAEIRAIVETMVPE